MIMQDLLDGASDPARHAALLLHAMPPLDRAWALEQLPPPQRVLLTGMLQELQQLGIPQDTALVDQAVASMGSPTSLHQTSTAPPHARDLPQPQTSLLAQLDADGCKALGLLLGKEPAALIARLLALGPWPWEDELLSQLGPAKRRHIEKLRITPDSAPGASALPRAILETIEAHLHKALQHAASVPSSKAASTGGKRAPRSLGLMSAFRRTGTSA